MTDLILFPSSFFGLEKVDEDLQYEYDSASSTGLFEIVLFDYNKWFNNGELKLSNHYGENRTAVYRGWMMKPEQYREFYNQLLNNNIELITKPEQYEFMHIFPNVYKRIKDYTAQIDTYPLHGEILVEELKKKYKRFMVKDFVKSVKGTEFPVFFDNTVSQEEFDKWMEEFYRYRGSLLTGGICIKQFLTLKRYGSKTNEYRVFYVNHEIASVSRNSGQGIYAPMPPKDLLDKFVNLESDYYTLDYAELDDGSWVIIEAGDGGVSGLSENQDCQAYYRSLYYCLNK